MCVTAGSWEGELGNGQRTSLEEAALLTRIETARESVQGGGRTSGWADLDSLVHSGLAHFRSHSKRLQHDDSANNEYDKVS